jgi:hypothetical protein
MALKNLNVELEEEIINSANTKASILKISLKEYIRRLILINCENISKIEIDSQDKKILNYKE